MSKKQLPSWNEVKKDIIENRNHSWIRETIGNNDLANKIFLDLELGISKEKFCAKYKDLDIPVMRYLVQNDITKAEFIYESFILAKALKSRGIDANDEIIACVDRTPEYVYLLGAANILSAKINLISEKFGNDFIINDVLKVQNWNSKMKSNEIDEAKKLGINEPIGEKYDKFVENLGYPKETQPKRILFCQDTKLRRLMPAINEVPEIPVISVPFKRSAKKLNYYEKFIKSFYDEKELISEKPNRIEEYDTFLSFGKKYNNKVENPSNLDTDFTISYSSGTTGKPKGIVHANKHYIIMGRYHDPKVSGVPVVKGITTYSNVPSYSNSCISSVISDDLIQNGTILLDPVDRLDYFPIGLRINNALANIASSSCWELLALDYFANPSKYNNYSIKKALLNFAVGEELLPGTEKICNEFFKKVKAGTSLPINNMKSPIPLAKMSTAGGSCETGSMFTRILRDVFNKLPNRKYKKDPIGMSHYNFIDVAVLREDGSQAKPYEMGKVVVNSDVVMKRYNNNPTETENLYTIDKNGKKWVDLKVLGYLDEKGNITIKDRYQIKENNIHEYMIVDAICRDTKNICSARVVEVEPGSYVAHIIFQPNKKASQEKILLGAKTRIYQELNQKIKISFVEHSLNNYYPLTKSLKKDDKKLIAMGYENVIELPSKGFSKTLRKGE